MPEPIPKLEHGRPVVTPADIAFELAISWRDLEASNHHYREIVQFRLDEERGAVIPNSDPRNWIGLEKEVAEALQLQKTVVEKNLGRFQALSAAERATLTPERRLECQTISLFWERQQALEQVSEHQRQERDHDRSR